MQKAKKDGGVKKNEADDEIVRLSNEFGVEV